MTRRSFLPSAILFLAFLHHAEMGGDQRHGVTPHYFEHQLQDWMQMNTSTQMVSTEAFEALLNSLRIGKMQSSSNHDHDHDYDHDHDHDHDHSHDHGRKHGHDLKYDHQRALRDDHDHDHDEAKCFSSEELLHIYEIEHSHDTAVSYFSFESLVSMFPALIQQQISKACEGSHAKNETVEKSEPTTAEKYGYGTLAVVAISVLPFLFIALIPSTKRQSYRYVMSCLMALSASTMLGDAFLHLLPQATGAHDHSGHQHDSDKSLVIEVEDYVLKQLVVISALYAFYLFEMLVSGRHHASMEDDGHGHGHGHSHMPDFSKPQPGDRSKSVDSQVQTANSCRLSQTEMAEVQIHQAGKLSSDLNNTYPQINPAVGSEVVCNIAANQIRASTATLDIDNVVIQKRAPLVHCHEDEAVEKVRPKMDEKADDSFFGKLLEELIPVKTLGWMVIVGDAIHNVIDGIALGAAFSADLLSGLSTAIAICCHEIPHEVGDFAALLTAGVTWRGAIIWNVIHSFLALGGLYIGLGIGADEQARQWVFALTAGMFIYVALTEMMPELTRVRGKFWTYFVCQNVGLLLGFGLMLVIAIFEEHMLLAFQGK